MASSQQCRHVLMQDKDGDGGLCSELMGLVSRLFLLLFVCFLGLRSSLLTHFSRLRKRQHLRWLRGSCVSHMPLPEPDSVPGGGG